VQQLAERVYRWKPNRATGGGSSYLLRLDQGNVLIDTPAWSEENAQILSDLGGMTYWVLTHRGGIGEVKPWYQHFGPQVALHEQEAFLFDGPVALPFRNDTSLLPGLELVWTPGHSPGSTCIRYADMLFSGRHLLPDSQGRPRPLRLAKTFHWPRQLRSVQKLLSGPPFSSIYPGAAVGLLRGKPRIENGWEQLQGWMNDPTPFAKI